MCLAKRPPTQIAAVINATMPKPKFDEITIMIPSAPSQPAKAIERMMSKRYCRWVFVVIAQGAESLQGVCHIAVLERYPTLR